MVGDCGGSNVVVCGEDLYRIMILFFLCWIDDVFGSLVGDVWRRRWLERGDVRES